MLILERSVTKKYWSKTYRKICRLIKSEQFEFVHGDVAKFQFRKDLIVYAQLDLHNGSYRPCAWLYLWKQKGWFAWEVIQVFVFDGFRGSGLSKKLYEAAINVDRLVILSGVTQSKSSRGLWKSFIKNNDFDVFAIDIKDTKRTSQVFWDDEFEEIWCTLEVYTRIPSRTTDVRIVASKIKGERNEQNIN